MKSNFGGSFRLLSFPERLLSSCEVKLDRVAFELQDAKKQKQILQSQMREFAHARDAAIKSANENKVLTQNFIVQLAEQERKIAELTQLNDQKDELNEELQQRHHAAQMQWEGKLGELLSSLHKERHTVEMMKESHALELQERQEKLDSCEQKIVELSAELEENKNALRQQNETKTTELSEQKESDLASAGHTDSPLQQASTSLTREISLVEKNMKSTMVESIQSITNHLTKRRNISSFYSVDDTTKTFQVGRKKSVPVSEKIKRVVPAADHKSNIAPNVCSICKDPPYGLMKTCSVCLRIFHSLCVGSSFTMDGLCESFTCQNCATEKEMVSSST